jgi:hypothetical protein
VAASNRPLNEPLTSRVVACNLNVKGILTEDIMKRMAGLVGFIVGAGAIVAYVFAFFVIVAAVFVSCVQWAMTVIR